MSDALPLFDKKPLSRRLKRPPAPPEFRSHVVVADLLGYLISPGWLWTHFPSGENRTEATGARLKRMGLKKGWPDFILVSPDGVFHGLELKRPGGALTHAQRDFKLHCAAYGWPYSVAFSVDEAKAVLNAWGAIRPVIGGT
jgi:hypothetical protein